eukprot:c52540_g1_i1.p1 GENE.c52540_g1_i1~~c52540_g1_i1.p1  ORF type:complete len:350 (-),score=69.36 c52540_g1_i1:20-1069(-)
MNLVVLSVCVVCAFGAPASIDTYLAPAVITVDNNGQNLTKYVHHAHRASLNFACNIDRITVTPRFEAFSAGFEEPLTQEELEDHIGDPNSIEWAHSLQMYFQSTDPRGQERQLGTVGGDLGEFLIVLAAIEQEKGKTFAAPEVLHFFRRYLTAMSREKFFFDIDLSAIENLKKACGCPQLNIADPPESKKDILANSTHERDSNGNEFFKKALADPAAFNIRPELIHSVLDAFYSVMWKKSDPLHRRIKFLLLKGEYAPKGFIIVKTPGYCNAQLLAPMISPELCDKQMGVYHGDAAVLLRTEIAGIILTQTPEDKNACVRKANELAANALAKVLEDHSEPIYIVTFEGF